VSHHRFMHLCSTANVVRSSVQSLTIHCDLIVVAPLSSTVMQEKNVWRRLDCRQPIRESSRRTGWLDPSLRRQIKSPIYMCPPSSDLPISARWTWLKTPFPLTPFYYSLSLIAFYLFINGVPQFSCRRTWQPYQCNYQPANGTAKWLPTCGEQQLGSAAQRHLCCHLHSHHTHHYIPPRARCHYATHAK
jgi:hypothetical protein